MLGLGVVLAIVVVLCVLPLEPRYGGRSLSGWLDLYSRNAIVVDQQIRLTQLNQRYHPQPNYIESRSKDIPAAEARMHEAADAVRQIGEKAIPYLVNTIVYEPGPFKRSLSRALEKLPGHRSLPSMINRYRESDAAVYGFEILGAAASSAIPKLLLIARDYTNSRPAWLATAALARVGTSAVPALIVLLTNSQTEIRINAASEMHLLGTNASRAIPPLVQCLTDNDNRLREIAAQTLGDLATEPDIVVPALARCLETSNFRVRCRALVALGKFGKEAHPARDQILKALDDLDEAVRSAATNAMLRISLGLASEGSKSKVEGSGRESP
jgi:hypothetical protein